MQALYPINFRIFFLKKRSRTNVFSIFCKRHISTPDTKKIIKLIVMICSASRKRSDIFRKYYLMLAADHSIHQHRQPDHRAERNSVSLLVINLRRALNLPRKLISDMDNSLLLTQFRQVYKLSEKDCARLVPLFESFAIKKNKHLFQQGDIAKYV